MTGATGGCLCGRVRYHTTGEPLAGIACHCRDCQYVSGGAEANVVVYPRAAVTVFGGGYTTFRSRAASGQGVWRAFCPDCGTPLFAGNEAHPEVLSIKAGTLDDPSHFTRQGHIWTASAPSWHLMEPQLPKATGNPEGL